MYCLEDSSSDDGGNAKRAKTAKKATNVAAAAPSSCRGSDAIKSGASSEDDGERRERPLLRTPRGRGHPKAEPRRRRISGSSTRGAVVPAILSEEAQNLRSSIRAAREEFEDGKLDGLRGREFQKQCTAWADMKTKAVAVAKKACKA